MDDRFISFRPATPDDEAFLLEVYGSTRAEELALTTWSAHQKSQFVQMQFTAQKLYYEANYPGAEFELILVDKVPAGRLYTHRTQEEIRIMDLSLLPHFRQRGIGTWILRKFQEAAALERRKVGIHVEIFNPAQRLYARLGFQRTIDKGVYYFMEWCPPGVVGSGRGG